MATPLPLGRSPRRRLLFLAALASACGTSLAAPNLVVDRLDTTLASVECQSGAISGAADVTVSNIGWSATLAPPTILVFEDRNGDGLWTPGVDGELGRQTLSAVLDHPTAPAPAVWNEELSIPLSGSVAFRDRPLHAVADPDGLELEADESDNVLASCRTQAYQPPAVDPFEMRLKLHILPESDVGRTPIVAHLTDDDGDGRFGPGDIPDLVFAPGLENTSAPYQIFSGDDGRFLFETQGGHALGSYPAVGDIDGDGRPEIVGSHELGDRLVAFNDDGSVRWISSVQPLGGTTGGPRSGGHPAIADLDGDGRVEVVVGTMVFDGENGLLLAHGEVQLGVIQRGLPSSASGEDGFFGTSLADVDGDGLIEIVAGRHIMKFNAGVMSLVSSSDPKRDGWTAIGDLDGDATAEIALKNGGEVWIYDHEGELEPSFPSGGVSLVADRGDPGANGGWPALANLSAEASPTDPELAEFGLQGKQFLHAFESDGGFLWNGYSWDGSSGSGAAAFDFDGDGRAEMVVRGDDGWLRIHGEGPSGAPTGTLGDELAKFPVRHNTGSEGPVIADVDGDGHAEILVAADSFGSANCMPGEHCGGVLVIEHVNDAWPPARGIWNQHGYHATNINDDMTVPRHEKRHWLHPAQEPWNVWRAQIAPYGAGQEPGVDLTASRLSVDRSDCPNSVTVTARIGNAGCAPVGPVSIGFYIQDPALGGIPQVVGQTSQTLEAGAYEDVSVTLAPAPSGTPIWAVADADLFGSGSITEVDETNNSCRSLSDDPCDDRPAPRALALALSPPAAPEHLDPFLQAVDVTDEATGAPVAGVFIDFEIANESHCRALTDAAGRAECMATPPVVDAIDHVLDADFAGSDRFGWVSTSLSQPFLPEQVQLTRTMPPIQGLRGRHLDAAVLARHDGAVAPPVGPDYRIQFDVVPTSTATEVMGPDGTASVTLTGLATGAGTHDVTSQVTNTRIFEPGLLTTEVTLLAPQLRLEPLAQLTTTTADGSVTARLLADSAPLPDVLVRFRLSSSPNPGSGVSGSGTCSPNPNCRTDASGLVTWTYTPSGSGAGLDRVEAFADIPDETGTEDGVHDPGDEPLITAGIHRVDVRPTQLTWDGVTSGHPPDAVRLAAKLEDSGTNTPVAGAALTLKLGGLDCRAVTDSLGVAECWLSPGGIWGSRTIEAHYSGSATHEPASFSGSFTVNREETVLRMITAPQQYNTEIDCRARLREDGALALANETVDFYLDGVYDGSATTNAQGIAEYLIENVFPPNAYHTVHAVFQQTSVHAGSTAPSAAVFVSSGPGTVINDPNPALFPAAPVLGGSAALPKSDEAVEVSWSEGTGGGLPTTGYLVHAVSTGTNFAVPATALSRVVTGLPNGTLESFTVTAVNEIGEAVSAPPNPSATPFAIPSAPTITTVTGSDGELEVCWSRPAEDGGYATLTYHISRMPNGETVDAGSPPPPPPPPPCHDLTGLTNGIPYSIRVRAENGEGHGVESALWDSTSPSTAPGKPTDVLAWAGNGEATVHWRRPASVGGSQIDSYMIANAAAPTVPLATVDGTAVHAVVDSLDNDVPIQFVVRAVNGSWISTDSDPSSSVTPAGPPGPPSGPVQVTAANGAIRVDWGAATDDNGSPITGYALENLAAPPLASNSSTAVATSEWITGLPNDGSTYNARVTSVNAAGADSLDGWLASQIPGTPMREPEATDAPTSLSDVAEGRAIDVTFPVLGIGLAGGGTVTEYEVTAFPGERSATVLASSCGTDCTVRVDGLANGVEYFFTVRARNEVGLGAESPFSNVIVPTGPPTCPREPRAELAGDGAIRLRWLHVGDDGGAPVTEYEVTCGTCPDPPTPASPVGYIPAAGAMFTGLTPGDDYTFEIKARNAANKLTTTNCSFVATAATVPQQPDSIAVAIADQSATVTWEPPDDPSDPPAAYGWDPLTHYLIQSIPAVGAPITVAADAVRSVTFDDLLNGTEYEFRVTAVNTVGEGSYAATTATPCTVPYPPRNVRVTPTGDRVLTLTWDAPAWDGGCPSGISGYTLWSDAPNPPVPAAPGATDRAAVYSGLTENTTYNFTITADNAAGPSALVPASGPAATCPGPTTNVVAIGGDELAWVCWDAPTDNGGAEVTDYVVRALPDNTPGHPDVVVHEVGGAETCAVVTGPAGLTNGQMYRFEVEATNGACWGPASADLVDDPCLLDVGASCPNPPSCSDPCAAGCPAGCPEPGTDPHQLDEATPKAPVPVVVAFSQPSVYPAEVAQATIELDALTGVDGATVTLTRTGDDQIGLLPPTLPAETAPVVLPDRVFIPPATSTVTFDVVGEVATTDLPAKLEASLNAVTADNTINVTDSACSGGVVAEIHSPLEAGEVWDYDTWVNVTATADCDSLDWYVESRLVDDCAACWRLLESDNTQLIAANAVRFDPTLLLNGLHEIRLRVQPSTGGEVTDSVTVLVRGNQKIGHFAMSFADATIPAGELPLQVIRTYDSRDPRIGDFGYGWQLSLTDIRLEMNREAGADWEYWTNQDNANWQQWPQNCMVESEPHVVSLTFPDGQTHRFKPIFELTPRAGNACQIAGFNEGYVRFEAVHPTRGSLLAVNGLTNTPAHDNKVYRTEGDDSILSTDPENPVVYDPRDFVFTRQDGIKFTFIDLTLARVESPNGHRLEISPNQITTQPANRSFTFTRDGTTGLITEIWDAQGEALLYGHDAATSQYLTSVTSRAERRKAIENGTQAAATLFTYIPLAGWPDRIETITDPLGKLASMSCYGTDGRLERVCDGLSDPATACGAAPPAGRCIELTHTLELNTELIKDRRNNITTLVYDDRGNVERRRLPGDPADWLFTYNDEDQPLTETNPLGEVTEYTYDDATGLPSRVTQVIDGGPDQVTDLTYDEDSNLLTIKAVLTAAWTYEYDGVGNVTKTTDPAGTPTTFEVDALGNVTKIIDALGNVTERQAGTGQEQQYPRWEMDADGVCTIYGYADEAGTPHYRSGNGNLLGLTRGVPTGVSCDLNNLDPDYPISVTIYGYDENDRLIRTRHPDDSVTGTIYDAAGRREYELKPHRAAADWTPIDEFGVPLQLTDLFKTWFEYNDLGQLKRIGHPTDVPEVYEFEQFHYDDSGNRDWQLDTAGRKTCFLADGQNRPWKSWLPEIVPGQPGLAPSGECESGLENTELLYDGAGRLKTRRVLTDRSNGIYSTWTFDYDDAGRRTHAHQPLVNGSSDSPITEYDEDGRVKRVRQPDTSP